MALAYRWLLSSATLAALVVLTLVAAACGGGGSTTVTGLASPADLRGRTVGVVSLTDGSTLEARLLLREAYGLDVSLDVGDVTLVESPAESLSTLLQSGDIDAAVVSHLGAFRLLDDERFRLLSRVTEELREITGTPIMSSILITYPDVADQRADALVELNRMLTESVTYFRANRDVVIEAVAVDQTIDVEFLRWWWDKHDLPLGDLSTDLQERLLHIWEAARTLGDIEEYPELASVLFNPEGDQEESPDAGEQSEATKGDRTTVSLALFDDASRRAVLYAIEQGIVTSDLVDIDLTYLPNSALMEAAPAKQYDVIEASPLLVPLGRAQDLDVVVLSGGLQRLDGTFLFVRNGR